MWLKVHVLNFTSYLTKVHVASFQACKKYTWIIIYAPVQRLRNAE